MINALVSKHIGVAFNGALKDAVTVFSGTRKGEAGVYDPVLDEYVGGADITYAGRGVFSSYKAQEIQATQIKTTDVKLTCLQSEVEQAPQIDDIITANGIERRVMNVSQDPAHSTWTIQLRGLNVG